MRTLASTSSRLAPTACVLACALAASPARAEVPSVDAYAGQALVLGKPHRPNSGDRSGAHGGPTASGGSSASGTNSTSSSGQNGSRATGRNGSSAGGKAVETTVSGQGAGAGSTQAGAAGGKSNGASGSNGQAIRSPTTLPAGISSSSESSSTFSGLDVLLLVAGFVCLLSTGVVLRLARRHG